MSKKSNTSGMMSISEMFKRQQGKPKSKRRDYKPNGNQATVPIFLESDVIDIDNIDDQIFHENEILNADVKSEIKTEEYSCSQAQEYEKNNSVTNRFSSRLSLKRKQSDLYNEKEVEESIKHQQIESFKSIRKKGTNVLPDDEKKFKNLDKEKKSILDGKIEVIESTSEKPYYQKNFETVLNSVLLDEDATYLFSKEDHAVFDVYTSLTEQARRLYVRLFGRKFKWIPLSKISYTEISENLQPYLHELTKFHLIDDEDSLIDLDDVLETLTAGDMKNLAKMYHMTPSITQKKQIVEELKKISQRSTVSAMFGSKGGINAALLKKAKTMVKGAYKLQKEARSALIRVMMLFSVVNCTGDEDKGNGGQGQLFQMLMVNMGKVVYPTYCVDKKHKLYKSREDVIRFEHSLQLESDLLHTIEKGNWLGAYEIYCSVVKELENLEQDESFSLWNKNLPDFLRPFTATSVLYGIHSQSIEILQRRKDYRDSVTLLKKLLNQQLYCCSHRGYWWERLALNLDVHLKQPLQALEAVAEGLKDDHVIGGHRLALFQRAESICGRAKLKLKDRITEFYHSPVRELPKVYLEGRILHQSVTTTGPRFLTEGSYANGNAQDMTVCGVEEFVLVHYKNNGYPFGLHAEGSIVTSLFGLFFWDILFMPVPDAFHSLYQAQPLDLYSTTSFYAARKAAFEERLANLSKNSSEALHEMMEETWNREYGKLCVGLNWDRLSSLDDMKGLVSCMGGKALSGILSRYAKCPRHTRSGFPDLTLWNVESKRWKICEVKGPGDKLSHKQILWIDYLLSLGVDAEVCHVKAVAAKKLTRPNR